MSSVAPSQKIEQLVQVIFDSTADRSIQWNTTPDEDVFRLASETANVRISKTKVIDHELDDFYLNRNLQIFNRQGRLVAEYRPRPGNQAEAFDDLFDLARRSAYNTDLLLDQLLEEIGGKRPQ